MTSKLALAAGVAGVLIVAPADAHHPGGTTNTSGAGPIFTISADTLEAGHVAVGFFYEYISLFGLKDADLIRAASQHQHAHSIRTIESASFGAAFGITNDLMVSFRLPYVRRTDIREGHHAHTHGVTLNTVDLRGDAAGLGDVTMLGQWRFFNNTVTATSAAVMFGVKLPTGRTDHIDRLGGPFEAEFQPGSGSLDKLIGLALTQRFGAWSLDSNMLYQFTGTGVQDTHLGDRLFYNAAVSYRLMGVAPTSAGALAGNRQAALSHSPTPSYRNLPKEITRRHGHDHAHDHAAEAPRPAWVVDLVVEFNGEWHDRQLAAGVVDPNSGGNVIYVAPGLRIGYGSVSGFASVALPVVNNMYGIQSKPGYRILSGIAAAF